MPRATTTERATKVPELRSGDRVLVLAGKDAGKQGEVERLVRPDRVVIAGINIAKRHRRPRTANESGGIVDIEAPLHISNLALVCPNCGRATRIGIHVQEGGRKVRYCKKCKEDIE